MSNDVCKIRSVIPIGKQKCADGASSTATTDGLLTTDGFIFGSTSPRGTVGSSGVVECLQKKNDLDKNISSCSTLEIEKLENSTTLDEIMLLKAEIMSLKQNLLKSENNLKEANKEKNRCHRRLEVISAANESRITEMHCVIAELTKKLRNRQDSTILEENEQDESEISFQEGSIYNSEMNLTNPDAECQTEPVEDCNNSFDDDIKLDINNDTISKTQIETLQEEVFHLKAHISLLESQLASNNEESSPEAQQDEEKEDENEVCYSEANKKNTDKQLINTKDFFINDNDGMTTAFLKDSAIKQSTTKYLNNENEMILHDTFQCQNKNVQNDGAPIPKMAERVKLRRMHPKESISTCVTGTDILNTGINKTELVEHLVSSMVQNNHMFDEFTEPSQLHIEFQRLQRRIEHLKIRNSVLSLTLDEVKEHCEHLYLLCGKYESNAVALQCALNCSDRAIEAYDVMLALLESKLAQLKDKSIAAEESRKAVEAVARHLLDRLESEKNLSENSLGPWQNTFCISENQLIDPWTSDDDYRLRNHVSKLKGRRSTVQNTIVNLESPFSSHYYDKARQAFESNKDAKLENTQMDLEMAVLMQELLSLREDVINAKQKRDESERDKKIAMQKIFLLQDTLQQLQNQLTDSEALLDLASRDRSSFSEADHAAIIERQLVEALTRESELKNRIQSLICSVSTSKKYDEKYVQVQNNLTELQKINFNLSHSLEQSKRKYQSKIKRLEQKILEMNQKNQQETTTVPETTL